MLQRQNSLNQGAETLTEFNPLPKHPLFNTQILYCSGGFLYPDLVFMLKAVCFSGSKQNFLNKYKALTYKNQRLASQLPSRK